MNADGDVANILQVVRVWAVKPWACTARVVSDPSNSFLIDRVTTDPRLRFRKNYEPIEVQGDVVLHPEPARVQAVKAPASGAAAEGKQGKPKAQLLLLK